MVLITETLALQDYARNKYNTCVIVINIWCNISQPLMEWVPSNHQKDPSFLRMRITIDNRVNITCSGRVS